MDRRTIFISHATPEDNDFVRWLGSRLIGHGYDVWSDLRELKGGAPFWSAIEEVLRGSARKMIFVVSKYSVDRERTGVLNELSVGDSIRKMLDDDSFIIPIRLDDTPFSDLPIQIHRLNALDFSKGWGQQLPSLLDTLESAKIPRSSNDRTREFDRWAQNLVRGSTMVEAGTERVLTNLMPINTLPEYIYYNEFSGDNSKLDEALRQTDIPTRRFNRLIVSLAATADIQAALSKEYAVSLRARVPLEDFLGEKVGDPLPPARADARNMVTHLLHRHVTRHLQLRGLRVLDVDARAPTFYFPDQLVNGNKVGYVAATGRKTSKAVVGTSERYKVQWHLAVRVNVTIGPPSFVRFKPFVCFSEHGRMITDAKRTSGIRRRFCRSWWNNHWRQLQEAFCAFLSDGREVIQIGLGAGKTFEVNGQALALKASMRISDDLLIADEPEEPLEPDLTDEPDLIDDDDRQEAVDPEEERND